MWDSKDMKQSPELSFDDQGRPVLITRAALPHDEQHRARVRKYLTLMSFRIPALVLAAVAYGVWHNGLISLAIIVASIPLPWIAVLIANDRPPRSASEPRRYPDARSGRRTPLFPTAERPALQAPVRPDPSAGSPHAGPGVPD
ncbi:transmembrane protein [Mycolicibacterium neoaurum]|uniref:Transmembrane protein n=2 Tax=Mycobacteriaceae TaxID=1762 RepID=A0AAV2WIA4_MYCNE|nr:transmembrane protein [Mycolicibacterium neoaurum]